MKFRKWLNREVEDAVFITTIIMVWGMAIIIWTSFVSPRWVPVVAILVAFAIWLLGLIFWIRRGK